VRFASEGERAKEAASAAEYRMTVTRRALARAGAALAAAALLPISRAPGQAQVHVRRSLDNLVREQSPLLESYRRGADEMMKRNVTDKTSWWFQANIHGTQATHSEFEGYWRQCPYKTYFFLSWQRMYLHFFERILRKACDDPDFALPYWDYHDAAQAALPSPFRPDALDQSVAALARRNPLARATRLDLVERGAIGLGDMAKPVAGVLGLDRFTAADGFEALQSFGGVRAADPLKPQAMGGIEACPTYAVHQTIGLGGDMGSPATAARDPIFWLHRANIDRLWVKWTDPARGRIPPVEDPVWMTTRFTFVDEDGQDVSMTGGEVLDTQFQLGYRYDDDPPRPQPLAFAEPTPLPPAVAEAPDLSPIYPRNPAVLARSSALRLDARQTQIVLAATRSIRPLIGRAAPRELRLALRDVVAKDRTPPYDVSLVLEYGSPFDAKSAAARLGELDLFGGAGHGGGGETIAFDLREAIAQLARVHGFGLGNLRVSIARRVFPISGGGEYLPPNPDPPRIGAIELIAL
jgi:tyrosinase